MVLEFQPIIVKLKTLAPGQITATDFYGQANNTDLLSYRFRDSDLIKNKDPRYKPGIDVYII